MNSATGVGVKLSSSNSAHPCRRFSFAEIQSATQCFDDELVIGRGGFGKVYKGQICSEETSLVVAIKRLDSMSNQGAPEFRAEIDMLSQLRHCHLVSLIGYCDDNKEMILVYVYMPHGTLYDHLHKAETPLNWVQRLKIAIGAARGLDYLHTGVGTQHGIIHRDVKSSNILLDENWAAMISDFGLSIIGPTNQPSSYVNASVKGTFGYLDPEYFLTRRLTRKTDVFAFGVVLFELLSGRHAVDIRFGEEECSLARWAQKCVKERKFDQMVDSNIRGRIFPKCLRRFAQIADCCLHSSPKERPTMAEVVVSLQSLLALQEKYDNSAEPSSIMGFTWKLHKYFVSSTKGNSEHGGTNSPKSIEDHINQCSSTNKDGNDHDEMPHQCEIIVDGDLKMFTYDELKCDIRDSVDHKCLGEGSYGKVYKGWLNQTTYSPSKHDAGLPIAVKQIHLSKFKVRLDLKLLREFSHPNLVKLIGYCFKDKTLLLVYQFMQNGSLEDWLLNGAIARLPLATKVKIAVGIARGIVFLQETQDVVRSSLWPLISMSPLKRHNILLKRHNILLDEDFTAKLSDYDVVKLVDGCYTPPEPSFATLECYYFPGFEPFQLQIDLHGFTVVFAEVLTGKRISNLNELWKMNDLLRDSLIIVSPDSLHSFARKCFEICNEEDSESKMLRLLKKFHK